MTRICHYPDSDTDSDIEEVERLRLDLRRKKAELEEQLRRAPPAAAPPARRGGRFEGAWLAYGDVSPLENAAAACFARELPDLDEARPRWAQCQLCLGWRDLGRAPGKPRKQNAPTREVASERVRARLALAEAGAWRPGERLGFGPAPEPERKVTAADLREAAKAAAAATPEPVRGAPSAVDALAAAVLLSRAVFALERDDSPSSPSRADDAGLRRVSAAVTPPTTPRATAAPATAAATSRGAPSRSRIAPRGKRRAMCGVRVVSFLCC